MRDPAARASCSVKLRSSLHPAKREFKLPRREAGPPNHHDDTVDSDQEVVNEEGLLLCEIEEQSAQAQQVTSPSRYTPPYSGLYTGVPRL